MNARHHLFGYITAIVFVLGQGCASQTSSPTVSESNLLATPFEAAQAAAISEVFERNPTRKGYRNAYGAIFFIGVSSRTLDLVGSRIGKNLPRLDNDLTRFDKDRSFDEVTQRRALMLSVRTRSADPEAPIFAIGMASGPGTAVDFRVEMRKTDQTWKANSFQMVGVE